MTTAIKTAHDVQELIQSGHFEQALTTAKHILATQGDDIYCLSVLAQADLSQGRIDAGKRALLRAHKLNPLERNINKNLGILCNRQGEFKQSVGYFVKTLTVHHNHPGILLDFLLMGISLCKINQELGVQVMGWVFSQSRALSLAYQNAQELPLIKEASVIANALIRDHKYQQQKHAVEKLTTDYKNPNTDRVYQFLDIFHGIQPPIYADSLQKPTYHVFPGLTPQAFYAAKDFSWAALLTENTGQIKQELFSLYNAKIAIRPYIDGVKTGNVGLDSLADSLDWSSIHLVKAGEYQQDLLQKCPTIKQILAELPLPVLAGNGPEVFLSVLKAGAEIKPHFGLSNIKLTVHLGLDIPDNCGLRAGEESQSWENGKLMIFDDSFEHEAWNHSVKDRFVLILEVWHPDLSDFERQAIQLIQQLQHQFSTTVAAENYDSLLQQVQQISQEWDS